MSPVVSEPPLAFFELVFVPIGPLTLPLTLAVRSALLFGAARIPHRPDAMFFTTAILAARGKRAVFVPKFPLPDARACFILAVLRLLFVSMPACAGTVTFALGKTAFFFDGPLGGPC